MAGKRDQLLRALEFKYVSDKELKRDPDLARLAARIGPEPFDYTRTNVVWSGYTLARDANGKLCYRSGQFDLGFHKRFRECGRDPER